MEVLQWCASQNVHKTVNIVVFFLEYDENTYPKGRAISQMYRVVSQMKRWNLMPYSLLNIY